MRTTLFCLLALAACSSPPPRADDTPALPERHDSESDDESTEPKIPEDPLVPSVPDDAGSDAATDAAAANVISAELDSAVERFTDARARHYLGSGAMSLVGGSAAPSVNLFFYGTAPGTYSCASSASKASMIYRTSQGGYQATSSMGSCTIAVSVVGSPGERIVGTYSATLKRLTGNGPVAIDVKGSFDVVRSGDLK